MTWDDINEKTVKSFIVPDRTSFEAFLDGLTPKPLKTQASDNLSFFGIDVHVNANLPPNKIAVCDDSGIIGFFDMEPEPPEMA